MIYEEKRNSIQRSEDNANAEWKRVALECVKTVATHESIFTADEVIEELSKFAVSTHDLRALGPVMRRAQKLGWITPTDNFVPSSRCNVHHQMIRRWKSWILEDCI